MPCVLPSQLGHRGGLGSGGFSTSLLVYQIGNCQGMIFSIKWDVVHEAQRMCFVLKAWECFSAPVRLVEGVKFLSCMYLHSRCPILCTRLYHHHKGYRCPPAYFPEPQVLWVSNKQTQWAWPCCWLSNAPRQQQERALRLEKQLGRQGDRIC